MSEQELNGAVQEPGKGKKKEKKKTTVAQEILSWVLTIVSALAIVFVIRTFVFEPIRVDGKSMTDTLQDNEILYCSKLDYIFGEIEHGDIVICNYPGRTDKLLGIIPEKTRFVKRVVGMPGDTVAIHDGVVYVNGEVVPDPENIHSKPVEDYPPQGMPGDTLTVEMMHYDRYDQDLCVYSVCTDPARENGLDFPVLQLGEDQYLVVGDNRGTSHDSRASDVGPISRDMILGKVKWVIFPFSAMRVAE